MASQKNLESLKTRFEDYISYCLENKSLDRLSTIELTNLVKKVKGHKSFSFTNNDFSVLTLDTDNPGYSAYVSSIKSDYPPTKDLLKSNYNVKALHKICMLLLPTVYTSHVFRNVKGENVRIFSLADFIGPIETNKFYMYDLLLPTSYNVLPISNSVHELIHVLNRNKNPKILNMLDDGITTTWAHSILPNPDRLLKEHSLVDSACIRHLGFNGFLLSKNLLNKIGGKEEYDQYMQKCKDKKRVICDPYLIDGTVREDKIPLAESLKIHTNYILSTFIVSYLLDTGRIDTLELVEVCSYADLEALCKSKSITMEQLEKDLYSKVKTQF